MLSHTRDCKSPHRLHQASQIKVHESSQVTIQKKPGLCVRTKAGNLAVLTQAGRVHLWCVRDDLVKVSCTNNILLQVYMDLLKQTIRINN